MNLLKFSLMSPKINSAPKNKSLVYEEEVNSTEGKLQGERNMSIMDERDEFKIFIQIMMKGFQDISHNIIESRQETKEFLAKQLGVKDG